MNYRYLLSWRGVILFMLAAIGIILLIAVPEDALPLSAFIMTLVATKVGAAAFLYAFYVLIRHFERNGAFEIEE